MMKEKLDSIIEQARKGIELSAEDVSLLWHELSTATLLDIAGESTRTRVPRKYDSCSIVNARSGRCSENCKWCAQSAHFKTGCNEYDIVDHDECMAQARHNARRGVMRFSLVASGRSLKGDALKRVCELLREVKTETGMHTCASLGLLGSDELKQLWENGVRRYHCNLETAPSYFPTLCTTHTIEDKLKTIAQAREIGFEICSGGIIGMGETADQRLEFALTLRRAQPLSIPVNILSPIPGTPLENVEPISDEDILRFIAILRIANPGVSIRFAGGRARLSHDMLVHCMRVGINGGIVGDMLTTTGVTMDEDIAMIREAGYEF